MPSASSTIGCGLRSSSLALAASSSAVLPSRHLRVFIAASTWAVKGEDLKIVRVELQRFAQFGNALRRRGLA